MSVDIEDNTPSDFMQPLPMQIPLETQQDLETFKSSLIQEETVVTTIQNVAIEKFIFEMDVASAQPSQVVPGNEGIPMRRAGTVDIGEITKRLFDSAVYNCDRIFRVDQELVGAIANELRQAIISPLNVIGTQLEPVLFRLVPAIALDRGSGTVVAYALGQLVSRSINDPKKRMLFRGYARDIHTQQILIKSIAESLLTANDGGN